jgi:superfamily II DNA or RNA helicase
LIAELKNPTSGDFVRTNNSEIYWEYRNRKTNRKLIVVDLDDDNEIRSHRLQYLADNKKVDSDTDFLIISLQVFIEGGDFPALDHVVNLRLDNSFVRMIQKWGRATRDYPGKTTATFVQFFYTNEVYGTEEADSLSEETLEDAIALQNLDIELDALEMQQLAITRAKIYVDSWGPPTKNENDSETTEIVIPPKMNQAENFYSLVFKNWPYVLAYTVFGGICGTAINYFIDYINKN